MARVIRHLHTLSRLYDAALVRSRLATSTLSGAVLAGLGDMAAQAGQAATSNCVPSQSDRRSPDLRRTASFSVFGGIVTGPINFLWLNHLERWTARLAPMGGMRALVCKVALQSFCLQPLIYLPTFFSVTAIVRRWSPAEAMARVRSDYFRTLQNLWVFWTPSVVFAFKLLPVRQQAVFFAGVGFAWNVVLSLMSNPSVPRLSLPRA